MATFYEEPATLVPTKKRKLNPIAMNEACRVGLSRKLLSLDVTNYTYILTKVLEKTDLNTCGSRLLLTSKKVVPSPLFGMFTSTEHAYVHEKTGLKVRSFDLFGREYNMVFKFLQSNNAYRIIGEWSRFLRQNADKMQVGDEIEIHAFRIPKGGDSELGFALLHCEKDREDEYCTREGCLHSKEENMELSPDERITVEALVKLKTSK